MGTRNWKNQVQRSKASEEIMKSKRLDWWCSFAKERPLTGAYQQLCKMTFKWNKTTILGKLQPLSQPKLSLRERGSRATVR